jgi:hypothetical protein
MARSSVTTLGILGCLILLDLSVAEGRTMDGIRPVSPPSTSTPSYCNTFHNVGRIALGVSNDGTFATQLAVSGSTRDCFTGETLPSCEYPKNSRTSYCFGGALWIGAVLGRDTLVSTAADGWSTAGNEFHPDELGMIYRSTIDPARPEFAGAVSEQDYIARYADTCMGCSGVTNDPIDGRAHRPLNIEVTQRTFAWSYSYAQDFVLFDYAVKNIGTDRLRRVYMGLYVDADIHDIALDGNVGAQDDLNGFREWQPALYMEEPCPKDSDQVNVAWTADNNGDFERTTLQPVPNVTATRIVRTPSDSLEVSFNWWVSNGNALLDYGPQTRRKVRDYGTGGTGTPEGDRNKFFILSNGEFDFDQARCATINEFDYPEWIPPPPDRAGHWATGLDTRYVLSFGPFDIEPGQSLPISLAYVGGMNFHQSPDNFMNLPDDPDSWYEGLNFDSLGANATWADWVYDNPGVDTDSDGYAGEFTVCDLAGDATFDVDTTVDSSQVPPDTTYDTNWHYTLSDTVWRKGDGVPDFRGATPPPAPSTYSTTDAAGRRVDGLRVESSVGGLIVRWNGVLCENTPDIFSRELDFEGYRVWVSRDERESSYSKVASYDINDYNRWDYNTDLERWELKKSPFTFQELFNMYAPEGDPTWSPLDYPRSRPLRVMDSLGGVVSIHYFEPQDFNQSILGNYPDSAQTAIRKTHPDAPRPSILDPDSLRVLYANDADSLSLYLTEDGFIKYYEYEYTLEGLLPTVPYWVNVTVFDYGSPSSGLAALETTPTLLPVVKYPLEIPDSDNPGASPVFVWPNPYRSDANYRADGFEARGQHDWPEDRTRLIHFANLPERCTISIFSLDGDLVREIQHPNPTPPIGCPSTAHETCWELITRNSQLVVSGMYYWTVEDEAGNIQMGKLVVIM